tara:strand:- start:724 stop:1023 length:300 start_codon:yes stop_codon:yes gene_type:complete
MINFKELKEKIKKEYNPYAYTYPLGGGRIGKGKPSIGQISTRGEKEIEDYQNGKPLANEVKSSLLFWAWHYGHLKNEKDADSWLKKNVKNKSAFKKLKD